VNVCRTGCPDSLRGRVHGRAVVGVDDVAARAAARAELAGDVVGPQQRERGVEQPRLLEVQPHGVDAVERAEAARAQAVERPPRRLLEIGQADLDLLFLPALEDAQDVAGLPHLEARQRVEEGQNPFLRDLLRCRRRVGDQPLRHAVGAVALAEAWALEGHLAVVVERGGPQHGAGLHHALLDLGDLVGVTAAGAAGLAGHAQVAGVDELDVVEALQQQARVGQLRIGGRLPELAIARHRVGLLLGGSRRSRASPPSRCACSASRSWRGRSCSPRSSCPRRPGSDAAAATPAARARRASPAAPRPAFLPRPGPGESAARAAARRRPRRPRPATGPARGRPRPGGRRAA